MGEILRSVYKEKEASKKGTASSLPTAFPILENVLPHYISRPSQRRLFPEKILFVTVAEYPSIVKFLKNPAGTATTLLVSYGRSYA